MVAARWQRPPGVILWPVTGLPLATIPSAFRSSIRIAVLSSASLAGFASLAAAQTEAALRSFFEGKVVTLRIDMPATSDGVDIRVDSSRAMDSKSYTDRLRRYGTSIHAGDSVKINQIHLKDDLIEFQIGGGGYGTFGDETGTSVDMPDIEKSNREKDLETQVKRETDATKKRALQRELDDLRRDRENANRRIAVARADAEARKRERIAAARLTKGSRFNLRYTRNVPEGIGPNEVMNALVEYVDFAPVTTGIVPPPPGGSSMASLPRKGMLRAEAERQFGRPIQTSERAEGTLRVTTLTFVRGDQRITAEFVEDVLIRYTIASR